MSVLKFEENIFSKIFPYFALSENFENNIRAEDMRLILHS
jgi:hypothetical protein